MEINKKIVALSASVGTFLLMPLAAFAILALPPLPNQTVNVWGIINAIIGFLWPLFFGIAIIMFMLAGFHFLTANGDANKISKGRDALVWGIVGVMVGVLSISIPYIIASLFNV